MKRAVGIGTEIEVVNLVKEKKLPKDFVGQSKYTSKYIGQLIRPDGSYYARTDRLAYYSKDERPHPAKTPLHISRWAVQEFTSPGDWVLDPTLGVGTTAVEALRLGRKAAGMELEFVKALKSNIRINNPFKLETRIVGGDARDIAKHIKDLPISLVVNNPPYSGDQRQSRFAKKIDGKWEDTQIHYCNKMNLGLLSENQEYWDTMEKIYKACVDRMEKGGRFIVGIKDMMRNKKPFLLHEMFGDILSKYLKFEGVVLLRHHPATHNMRTYVIIHKIPVPLYQVILIFKK